MSANALGTFLTKFEDWKFCPPSDNLWTINILLSGRNDGKNGTSFGTLFSNINLVNSKFNNMYSPKWSLKYEDDDSYISKLQDPDIGLFLATDITFNANNVSISDSQSPINQQFSGFLSYGKVQQGRGHNHEAKIQLLKSNWDINDIFIDKWIAAIGQQGLIEDSRLPNIKANIIITEYSAGIPIEGSNNGKWFPRKQISLIRAFPKDRDQMKYSYSPDTAGDFKTCMVTFEFDSFQIKYFPLPTPGYITPSTAAGTSEVGPTLTSADIERINGDKYK